MDEGTPVWAQGLIAKLDRLEANVDELGNLVNNCVMTRLDAIEGKVDTLTTEVGALKTEVGTLAESYDDLRGMKGKVDELYDRWFESSR